MPVIHPDHPRKLLWDAVVIGATIVATIETPLTIVLDYPMEPGMVAYEIIVSAIFLTDVIVNFFTAIQRNKALVTDQREIARSYLRRWFAVDFLSAIPFDVLFSGASLAGASRFLRLLRLTRLLRLLRLAQFIGKLGRKSPIHPSLLRMLHLVFWVLLSEHFIACIWLFLGSGNAAATNAGYAPDDSLRNYLRALYWTTTTIVTIGYGDITPVTNLQTVYAMSIQLLGAALYGFIIGNIASLIANLDAAGAQHREKIERIQAFMMYKKIPLKTQDKVYDYYSYLWDTRRGYDEFLIINDLPSPLKAEVLLFLNRSMIEKVAIFKGASPELVTEIVLNLRPVVFSPGDYVFHKGEVGHNMYFISTGSVDVVSEDDEVYATLEEGNFFGEIALLLSEPRTASIRARDYCDLYTLDKETFDRVLGRHPEFQKQIHELASKRREEMPKRPPKEPTQV